MKALFADLFERTRQRRADSRAHSANERRQVIALFDAIQVAIAKGQHDRVSMLLKEMHAVVRSALARRNRVPRRTERVGGNNSFRRHDEEPRDASATAPRGRMPEPPVLVVEFVAGPSEDTQRLGNEPAP